MANIVVEDIYKSYSNVDAVVDLNFKVEEKEVFGLLGPNGAGKSTTIRMLLDFLKPDKGTIELLGEKFSEATKSSVGYLPEERGLYDNLTVEQNLIYLASLKGTEEADAKHRAKKLLERVGLASKKDAKVNALSKGLRQLCQLCLTLIHEPTLLILDEPFAGLDPTNRELVKEIIREEKEKGRTIILSTHMMNEVEELCDRVLLINHGRRVLYGTIDDIKQSYASHCVFVEFEGAFPTLEGLQSSQITNNSAELYLRVDSTPQEILKQLVDAGTIVKKFDVKELSLNQIFIKVVEAEKWIKP